MDVRKAENEPFHEVGERHQQREVEHHTVDDIISGLLDIGIGARFIPPRRTRQFQSLLIIVLQEFGFGSIQIFVGKLVQFIQSVAGDAEPFIETGTVFIKPPHISDNDVRREADLPVLPNDEPLTRVKRRVFHAALCGFDEEQSLPDLPVCHSHFDAGFRFAVNERDRFGGGNAFLLPRFRHPELFGWAIRERIVNLQFAQSS